MQLVVFVLKRVGAAAVSLLVVSFLMFLLVRVLPGNTAEVLLGLRATPQSVAQVTKNLGLDRPVLSQYWIWLRDALQGNLGGSTATSGAAGAVSFTPVSSIVLGGLDITAWLTGLGTLVAAALGVALGIFGATRRHWASDAMTSGVSVLGVSTPDFFLALLLILLFTVHLGWLPSVGFVSPFSNFVQGLRSLALPVMTIGIINASAVARMTRTAMLETAGAEFMTVVRARGAPPSVLVLKHQLKNVLVPVLTVVGLQLGFLLGGVVIIEEVFGLPGMGRLLIVAVQQRDYPTIEGLVVTFAALFLAVNLVIDVLYAVIDPRIRVR